VRELTHTPPDAEVDGRRVITAVDLFSGAGGMSVGLQRAGIHVLAALDLWEPAVRTYAENFDHPIIQADAARIDPLEFAEQIGVSPGEVDLVVGGPPCQGFSVQRIGADNDVRNDLVLRYAEFVKALRPRMFLMENVLGLLGKRGRHVALRFEHILRLAGYEVHVARVNTAEYGVPQTRKRVVYYGWQSGKVPPFKFPRGRIPSEAFATVAQAIADLPTPPEAGSASVADELHIQSRLSAKNRERLTLIPPGGGFEDLPVELRVDCHKNGADKIGHRGVYGRLDPDRPAGTITARFDSFTRGRFAHPFEHRNITLREGARLQTFDDSFRFVGNREEVAALIGNAVPPLLAEELGRAVLEHLTHTAPASSPDPVAQNRRQIDIFALENV
jgi:DNA (cytosine-5)-methyltransferase 1